MVLAGSIRDDGPLPEVITDTLQAQARMREAIQGVGFALLIATALHSIATGNLLPAWVKVVCVDINPGHRDQAQRPRHVPDGRPGHRRRAVLRAAWPPSWPGIEPHRRGAVEGRCRDPSALAYLASSPFPREAPMLSPTPRILMCPPDYYGIEYEINPWMNRRGGERPGRVAPAVAGVARHPARPGRDVERLDPVPGLPDLVFTANAGLVYRDTFISSRFRHGVRQGETPHFERWAREHGFGSSRCPAGFHFEGAGDALFCGETLYAGYRFRSDARSHHWIGEHLGVEVLPLELVDPRFYHLDTCFCPLADGEAIYYPGAFDDYGRSVLADRIPRLIEVSAEEAASFSCNAVVVGRTVILNDGTPKLARCPGGRRLRRPAAAA